MKHRICDTCSKKLKHTVELSFFQSIIHRLKGHKIYKTEFYEGSISIPKTTVVKIPPVSERRVRVKPIVERGKPSKAIYQDYGKFFKGKSKHQHKTYRRSVKAHKKPEEDN